MGRLEKKTSRTAGYTCMNRAAAFYDKNPFYHIDDDIAAQLLPKILNFLLRFHILSLKGKMSPKGIYEYVIARTKYIDEIVRQVIKNKFDQILIFGAGFDSRGIRFIKNNQTKLFELDSSLTQQAKINKLKKRGISVTGSVIYIPIDFNKDSVSEKLDQSGFQKHKKCLYILEGLLMYLDKNSVDSTFQIIKEYSERGSLVVFDYLYSSVLRKENKYYGEAEIYNKVNKTREAWTFGIEEGKIGEFLDSQNLQLLEHYDAAALEEKYFKAKNGERIGRVNGTHNIVLAEIR
ncbi:class I SAM-dependent methyltransferase [candidate division KSB1 bacterium]|nr:class I SAM-dependent methyltransferase [candidate division KSB1 bacterium]